MPNPIWHLLFLAFFFVLLAVLKFKRIRGGLVALLVFPFRLLFGKGKKPKHGFELVSRQAFFTQSERNFFSFLEGIAKQHKLLIFSKVRLADVVTEAPGAKSQFHRYGNMHVDYLLVKSDNFAIVAGIELDGESHLDKRQQYNDEKKDQIFKSARVPILRFKNDCESNPAKVRKEIDKVIRKSI
ncbi:MAG TPA: hypothetical protein DD435_02095 [Cyanobacteria bacterium UBA8530]|nr:hypothetical protein [Cyanobacteria bacterium UBA8530]